MPMLWREDEDMPEEISTASIASTLLQIYAGGWQHSLFIAASRRLLEQDAEVRRLLAGGCARDQKTTQFCQEAVSLAAKNHELTTENNLLKQQLSAAMTYVENDLAEGSERQL